MSVVAVLALLPAFLIALAWADRERSAALAEAETHLRSTLSQIARVNGIIYDQVAPVLQALGELPEIKSLDAARCQESLPAVLEGSNRFVGLVLADPTGKIVCDGHRASTTTYRGDRLDFRRAVATRRFAVGDYSIGRESGQPGIRFGQPVFASDGALAGVLTGSLSVQRLNDYLARIPLPPKNTLILTDAGGTVLASQPEGMRTIGTTLPRHSGQGILKYRDVDEVVRLFATAPLTDNPDAGLTLWLGVDEKDITRSADSVFSHTLKLGGALAIGMAMFMWLTSFWLLRKPARRLARAAQQIAVGDFTPRPARAQEAGELGEVGAALDEMATKLAAREAALIESELRFRATFENASVGIGHIALDGRWLRVNDTLCRITGYTRDELLARGLDDISHPDDMPEGWVKAQRLLAGEIGDYRRQKRCVRKDGAIVWVALTVSLARKSDGHPDYFISVTEDITERKQAEEHATLLTREINHRAKNLLTVVQAVARQTAGEVHPKVFAESFGQRLAGLATSHDLLARNQWRGVDAADLVRSQLTHVGALMGTRVEFEGPLLRLRASAAQALGMALHELATNALKHGALSNSEGAVQIKWDLVTNGAELCFTMTWSEHGGPAQKPPQRRGFGHTVLVRMAEHALDARVQLEYSDAGLVWSLHAPAERVLGGDTVAREKDSSELAL